MNIILFGFTGLGNAVLRGLFKSNNVRVKSVFTKKYSSPYPYYNEVQMEELCERENIACYIDKKVNCVEVIDLIKKSEPDLIVVASFSQIISKEIIEIPKLGIVNLHPSLLPKYRGPYPDQGVLLNNEKETGITIHYLTEKLDSGNIILQKRFDLCSDENYSALKKRISELSEEMITEVIELFRNGSKPKGTVQKESEATYFPKPKTEDGYIENDMDIELIKTKVKALNPFPGTSILVNGIRIDVDNYKLINSSDSGDSVIEEDNFVDVHNTSGSIRLLKKKKDQQFN